MTSTHRCHAVLLLGLLTSLTVMASRAAADVTLPAIFSDHMVIQREAAAVPIWGWADPGEEVQVTFDYGSSARSQAATASAEGKWRINFGKFPAEKPFTLKIKGKNEIAIHDVVIGEVWLCSGQSNMGMSVSGAKDFEQERTAANYPQIRVFTVTSGPAEMPQDKCTGKWDVCTPDTVGHFSATAYFFGRDLHMALKVPVGLINSSVGGTPIEAWTSMHAQRAHPELKPLEERWVKMEAGWEAGKAQEKYEHDLAAWKETAAKAKADGKLAPRQPTKPAEPRLSDHHPATLFNGKIAPLIPFAIRGAIWYQGESNAGNEANLYGLQLETLVRDWRTRWGEEDFPFAWVQLPNFQKPQIAPVENGGWPLVREGMLNDLKLPNTGMAITIDIGEANNIHPHDKQDVGKRLAMWALAKVYGEKGASSGPSPAGHEVQGSTMILSFKNADEGLVAKGGDLKGFAIAAADKKWHKAEAKIDGEHVVVSSPEVKEPVAVRYAWASNPDCNLYNGAGLPASPFRTDDWAQ